MGERGVEVTVPVALELATALGEGSLHVSLDRRVACSLRPAPGRIVIESRDSGQKLELAPGNAAASGETALVLAVMRRLGLSEGSFVLHRRVPLGSGLVVLPSVAVAVAAAVLDRLGREVAEAAAVAQVAAADAGFEEEPARYVAPVRGGVVVVDPSGSRSETVAVDPARIEECLILVDTGAPAEAGASPVDLGNSFGRIVEAVREGRMQDVTRLLGEAGIPRGDESSARIAAIASEAGGALLPRASRGGYVAVFAVPGERGPGPKEALETLLREAGLRTVRPRVDLLGLEKG